MSALTTLDRIAPEFASRANRAQFLADAGVFISPRNWRTAAAYELALAYYAAHLMTGAPEDGSSPNSGGPLLSVKTGDLSETYANWATQLGVDPLLAGSRYGQLYISLVRGALISPRIASLGA